MVDVSRVWVIPSQCPSLSFKHDQISSCLLAPFSNSQTKLNPQCSHRMPPSSPYHPRGCLRVCHAAWLTEGKPRAPPVICIELSHCSCSLKCSMISDAIILANCFSTAKQVLPNPDTLKKLQRGRLQHFLTPSVALALFPPQDQTGRNRKCSEHTGSRSDYYSVKRFWGHVKLEPERSWESS